MWCFCRASFTISSSFDGRDRMREGTGWGTEGTGQGGVKPWLVIKLLTIKGNFADLVCYDKTMAHRIWRGLLDAMASSIQSVPYWIPTKLPEGFYIGEILKGFVFGILLYRDFFAEVISSLVISTPMKMPLSDITFLPVGVSFLRRLG